MSIAILSEAYTETRRLAIAGSGLASADFRLKKLIAPLEKAGERAPVFAKVAEAMKSVVESDAKSASGALLELSTLLTAILYTQGKTGVEGELRPIETSGLTIPSSDSSARVLKPLIEALTTTGSGRLEIIQDAFNRGAFNDLRLVKPAIAAIDDVYGEIGEFVATHVLPMYGKSLMPDLRESFDIKGKGGHVRRLRLMHGLDPEASQDLVEAALESGSKEMKIAAIACLKNSKGHLSYMLEQTRAKAKDVRQAAFTAIARFTQSEVVDSFIKALSGGDVEPVAKALSHNRSPKLLRYLLEEGQKQLDGLLTATDKATQKKAQLRFYQLLRGFATRDDSGSEKFLIHCFNQREAIARLKDSACDGEAINLRVAALLVRSNSATASKALIAAHETLAPNALALALVAAIRTRKPKQVFKLFSPYYVSRAGARRGRSFAKEKQAIIQRSLQEVGGVQLFHGHRHEFYEAIDLNATEFAELTSGAELYPAWLDAAVAAEDLTTVRCLARPKNKGAIAFLARSLDELLAKAGDQDHDIAVVLDSMIRMKHPRVVEYFLMALERLGKSTRRHYYAWYLVRLIPGLPKAAAPKIEALLPSLNETTVDAVLPQLHELNR